LRLIELGEGAGISDRKHAGKFGELLYVKVNSVTIAV